jgi:Helix-turn-helix domain
MSPDDRATVEEAAAEFGLHRTTLFRYIAEGRLARQRLLGDRKTYVSRSDLQRLVDSPTVTRCLQLIYEPFGRTGTWPIATNVQRDRARAGDEFDFLAALETLPPDLGWRVRDTEGSTQLTLRGIARCEGSAADVSAFLALIRICYERYIGDDENLVVRSAELGETLSLDPLTLAKLYQIVQIESGFWSGLGMGSDSAWTLTINADRIRHFRGVTSLSEYWGAKERAFQVTAMIQGPAYGMPAPDALDPSADFHPAIAEAVGDLLGDNPTAAVLAAATAFERLIAGRVGPDRRYGQDLVAAYFDLVQRGAPPHPRRVESLKSIALGTLGAFSSPAAHGRLDFYGFYAREVVALYSLLAREVEALSVPSPPTLPPAKGT